ncbi:MAG: putative Ig domain-containing protein [Bacteroidales bacterium]|nr:putative Ig domain-containing protein [Bacteroidales bacterium]
MKRIFITLALMAVSLSAAAQLPGEDSIVIPDYSAYILTPKAPDTPRINGPKIYGARPKADFLYRIPATGVRPMRFEAKGLPRGLKLDAEKGIITGNARKKGEYKVQLTAVNALGSDTRELRIVIGDRIALTPPLGWNSWNCWGNKVSQDMVMQSGRAMVESGLADYGWCYINIDDGWQGVRGGKYKGIQPNNKFPDMKALGDYLHSMGLKFGIYSGPWVTTYAGHIGSSCDNEEGTYQWIEEGLVDEVYKLDRAKVNREEKRYFGKVSFAKQDAQQWADWGVDYLKYDWNINDVWWLRDMREAIDATGRDIVYSISNHSRVTLGPELLKNAECWRTTGDIRDTWQSMSTIGFEGQERWAGFTGPGNWPDADMLVLGKVGWGRKMHWTELTPWEQYTHITLWSILASPMLLGCDMAMLDPFTLSLLCNNEVLDVNQDPLGIKGTVFAKGEGHVVYVKPLEDGSVAVALFNLGDQERTMGFTPHKIGLYGEQTVRDLWRQQDVGKVTAKQRWETTVQPHGCAFYRLSPGITSEKLVGLYRQ